MSSYEKSIDAMGITRFCVRPSKVWRVGVVGWLAIVVLFVIVGIPLVLVAFLGGKIFATGVAVLIGILMLAIWFDFRHRRQHVFRKSTFQVSPAGIDCRGQRLATSDITLLKIGHAYEYDGYDGRRTVGAALSRGAYAARQRAGYTVAAIVGGRALILAGGLEEHTAEALQLDVARVLGFS